MRAHTNNVINYCESHDENSVQFEVATGGEHLQDPEIKERKGLALTADHHGGPGAADDLYGAGVRRGEERNRIKVN